MVDETSSIDPTQRPAGAVTAGTPPPQESPAALLLRVREGDQRAFRALYDQAAPRLLAKAVSIVGSRDGAEDALQEAFVRIWRHAGQFDPARGTASAWMARVLRNAAVDRLRQDRLIARYQCAGEELPEIAVAPEPVMERVDLERSLATLSAEQRTTICRVVVQGWTHDEVGSADRVPTPTAKARAQRGLVRLRTALTEAEYDSQACGQRVKAVA